ALLPCVPASRTRARVHRKDGLKRSSFGTARPRRSGFAIGAERCAVAEHVRLMARSRVAPDRVAAAPPVNELNRIGRAAGRPFGGWAWPPLKLPLGAPRVPT